MLTAEFRRWRRAEPGAHAPDPTAVGALSPSVLAALDARGLAPSTATVTAARRDIGHALRDPKVERGQAVSSADIDRLPEALARSLGAPASSPASSLEMRFAHAGEDAGAPRGEHEISCTRPPFERQPPAAPPNAIALYTLLDGSLD